MGKFFDFIVEEPDDKAELGSEILCRICIARLRAGFQVFIFIAGGDTTGTGHGKSYFVLRWIDKLLAKLGIKFEEYFEDIVVFTPLEYLEKMNAILKDPRLKHIPVLMVDEVSEVLDATEWQTFVNKAIRSVNVKSRGVKNIVVFFLSPDIHDLEKGSRRMLTFYGECTRPLSGSTKVVLERPYKVRRGLEDVFYDTRTIKGIVRGKKKNYYLYPSFKIKLPRKEITDIYDPIQRERKAAMVGRDIEEAISILKKKYGEKYDRVDLIVSKFIEKPEMQPLFFKWGRKKGQDALKLQPEFSKAFDLNPSEQQEFISRFLNKYKQNQKIEQEVYNAQSTTSAVHEE